MEPIIFRPKYKLEYCLTPASAFFIFAINLTIVLMKIIDGRQILFEDAICIFSLTSVFIFNSRTIKSIELADWISIHRNLYKPYYLEYIDFKFIFENNLVFTKTSLALDNYSNKDELLSIINEIAASGRLVVGQITEKERLHAVKEKKIATGIVISCLVLFIGARAISIIFDIHLFGAIFDSIIAFLIIAILGYLACKIINKLSAKAMK